jgi:hypothetical protein
MSRIPKCIDEVSAEQRAKDLGKSDDDDFLRNLPLDDADLFHEALNNLFHTDPKRYRRIMRASPSTGSVEEFSVAGAGFLPPYLEPRAPAPVDRFYESETFAYQGRKPRRARQLRDRRYT